MFAYPTRPEINVFEGINLTVKAGTTVALVGQSGSGKSTIVGLVERYYDPQAGSVCLDGVPLPELDLLWLRDQVRMQRGTSATEPCYASLRHCSVSIATVTYPLSCIGALVVPPPQVGLVSQEPTLFATSIFENIKYGRPSATEEEVYAAAKASNAHDFISALPSKYKTTVGEGGVQLSGGQKQRVAIARALLKDPKVLLLDEATSALDAESERLVQSALEKLMEGRTTIVVAHRLSTIRNADHICVLQQGIMVEEGTHHGLLENPTGAYSQLVALQQSPEGASSANLAASSTRSISKVMPVPFMDPR